MRGEEEDKTREGEVEKIEEEAEEEQQTSASGMPRVPRGEVESEDKKEETARIAHPRRNCSTGEAEGDAGHGDK